MTSKGIVQLGAASQVMTPLIVAPPSPSSTVN
jgi:hypothetical protein